MKIYALIIIFSAWLANSFAQTPMPLYPNGVPNSKPVPSTYKEGLNEWGGVTKVSVPTLTPFLLNDGATHTAV